MTRRTGDFAVGIVATLFVVVVIYQSLALGRVARLVPLTVAVPTLGLLLVHLLRGRFPALGRVTEQPGLRSILTRPAGPAGRRAPDSPAPSSATPAASPARIFVWMAILMSLVYALGFLVAGPIFLAAYLRLVAGARWRVVVVVTGVVASVPYVLAPMLPILSLSDGQLWHWIR